MNIELNSYQEYLKSLTTKGYNKLYLIQLATEGIVKYKTMLPNDSDYEAALAALHRQAIIDYNPANIL